MKLMIRFLLLITLLVGCIEQNQATSEKGLSLSKAMAASAETEFKKAYEPKAFIFPEDHGAHPDFRTEWWYFTGNLISEDGERFGYQFTIFRTALSVAKIDRDSPWNSNQIYMAHFAVSDIRRDRFYYMERFSREGNNLAGAQVNPLRIWQEDWHIIQISEEESFDLPVILIMAKNKDAEIEITLRALKPYVLQGNKGLSQKGKKPGNASYYYSYTRLATAGRIRINGQEFRVSGESWLDREWSTSALDNSQAGWDWFALQLDDSTEIMYYQMRGYDGIPDEYSKGIIVHREGVSQTIPKHEVELEILDYWQSPQGRQYPSGWRLHIPSRQIDLNINPAIRNQLLDVTVTYWEGSVQISGKKNGAEITGRGYVELTGY